MSPQFDPAVDYVLKNEGGYGWDPFDAGGPTNFGITQHDLAAWREQPVTPDDVKNMTVDEAKAIYFARYWKPLGLENVLPTAIATCILDTGVLYGIHIGALFAQKAANAQNKGLAEDGMIGPKSTAALNSVDVKAFVETYVANILARIDAIVHARPTQRRFQAGWTNRAKRLLTLV